MVWKRKGKNNVMKWVNGIAMILLVAGGLNWGLVALFGFDLVQALSFGVAGIDMFIKSLVGLSGVYGLWLIVREFM